MTPRPLPPVRSSSVPAAYHCPMSIVLGPKAPGSRSGASDKGTLIHQRLAAVVLGSDPIFEGLDADERGLFASGLNIWNALKKVVVDGEPLIGPHPLTEYPVGPDDRRGHVDVLDLSSPGRITAIDWKSGYREHADAFLQLADYLALAMQQAPACLEPAVERFIGIIAWLRSGEYETREFTRQELEEHLARVDRQRRMAAEMIELGGEDEVLLGAYTTGPHCSLCRCHAICPAINHSLAAVDWSAESLIAGKSDKAIVELRGIVALAKRRIDDFEKAVRARVEINGPMPLGDGRELALVPQDRREIVCGSRTWTVLTETGGLSTGDIAAILSIGNGDLKAAISAKAPRGMKGKMIDATWAALDVQGLVETNQIFRLTERPIEAKQIESEETNVSKPTAA